MKPNCNVKLFAPWWSLNFQANFVPYKQTMCTQILESKLCTHPSTMGKPERWWLGRKVLTPESETQKLNKSPLALDKVPMSKTKVQIIHLGASKNDTGALCWFWVCLAYLSSTKFLLWYTVGKCLLSVFHVHSRHCQFA